MEENIKLGDPIYKMHINPREPNKAFVQEYIREQFGLRIGPVVFFGSFDECRELMNSKPLSQRFGFSEKLK